jgi:hypothetical protein
MFIWSDIEEKNDGEGVTKKDDAEEIAFDKEIGFDKALDDFFGLMVFCPCLCLWFCLCLSFCPCRFNGFVHVLVFDTIFVVLVGRQGLER